MDIQFKKISIYKILILFLLSAFLLIYTFSYFKERATTEALILANAELNDLKYKNNLENQRNKISLLLDLINKLNSTNLILQDRSMTNKMIDRIVSLSSSFKKHKVWEMENNKYFSLYSERRLLLLALVKTKMDSISIHKILENVSFYGADLKNVDFHNLNLNGIYLKNANLENANLEGINLDFANLHGVSLIGANLNHASLVGANLISAKLYEAKLNEVNFKMAKLDSADFSNATVENSNLNGASLMYSTLCNAKFCKSDFNYSVLISTNMSNTNLSKTLLTHADIYRTDFRSAILNYAIVDVNWKKRLLQKNNKGVNLMMEKYKIFSDTISVLDSIIYRLLPQVQ